MIRKVNLLPLFLSFLMCAALLCMQANAASESPPQYVQTFFDKMVPNVQAVNTHIINDRQHILALQKKWSNHYLSVTDQHWLNTLAHNYQLPATDNTAITDTTWRQLLVRVQPIPMAITLAQAAEESGFGSSRFATTANNYFGQHCTAKGCGIPPKQPNLHHYFELAVFPSMQASIAAYARNLNTHPAYEPFRILRNQYMDHFDDLDTLHQLIHTLNVYSGLNQAYADNLWKLINTYQLHKYPPST